MIGRFVELDPGWKRFETLDFQFDVPDGFSYVPAPKTPPPVGLFSSLFQKEKSSQITLTESF